MGRRIAAFEMKKQLATGNWQLAFVSLFLSP